MNAENMYDAWDNGDRHEIRQQLAKREKERIQHMTDRELMQQALAVLQKHVDYYDYEHFTSVCELEPAKDLILALRERLAQPEQREVEIEFKEWMHPQIGVVPVDPKTPLILKAHIREKNT